MKKIKVFILESYGELKKVVWPNGNPYWLPPGS